MTPPEESRLEVENRFAALQTLSLPSVVAHAPAIPAPRRLRQGIANLRPI